MKKKIFFGILLLLSLLCFNDYCVKAACATGVTVGDENLCLVSNCPIGATDCTFESLSNQNKTAYTKQLTDGSIILVLNNYSGKSITFYSGLGNPLGALKIELIGDNYITAEDNYGIQLLMSGLEFIGDGTLTIKSKIPFVAIDGDTQKTNINLDSSSVSTIKITAGENNQVSMDNTTNNKENNNELSNNSNEESNITNEDIVIEKNNLSTIVLITSLCVSILCVIISVILVIKNNKLKNK